MGGCRAGSSLCHCRCLCKTRPASKWACQINLLKRQIAIIGGGFAGLATCSALLKKGHEITLFDPLEESASALSAGLLHPYVGSRARKNWRGDEGMAATLDLLEVASNALGQKVYRTGGLLRLPADEEQERDFRQCAESHPDTEWWDAERVQEALPASQGWGGLYIQSGVAVESDLYLEGLRLACQARGAHLRQERAQSIDSLRPHFDLILITAGAASRKLLPDLKPELRQIKGQILTLRWPDELPPPSLPVCMPNYLIPNRDGASCLLGATYERHPSSDKPEPEVALKELFPALARLYPQLVDLEVLECRAGYRATLPGHRPPSWVQLDNQVWRFAGLGSRGLLYHALLTAEGLPAYP